MRSKEQVFKNGLSTENTIILIHKLIETLKENDMNYQLDNEEIIDIYEECKEMRQIKEEVSFEDALKLNSWKRRQR